jgi:hypothetical protein
VESRVALRLAIINIAMPSPLSQLLPREGISIRVAYLNGSAELSRASRKGAEVKVGQMMIN